MRQTHPHALEVFRDSYVLDFLTLPDGHSESDLHKGLLEKLKHFLLELGRDFVSSAANIRCMLENKISRLIYYFFIAV